MSFWDNVKEMAGQALDAKQGEIGDYLDSVVSGTFARIAEPTVQQQQNSPAIAAAAAAASPTEMLKKYAIPAAALLVVLVLIARQRK